MRKGEMNGLFAKEGERDRRNEKNNVTRGWREKNGKFLIYIVLEI